MNGRSSDQLLIQSCDVETFKSGGKGGQHQNKTESGVRLRHRPTGIVAICRAERSQHLNKSRCLEILRKKIEKLTEKTQPRIPTAVPKRIKRKILEVKRRTGKKKQLRKKPAIAD
jgi:ribosome-associated protein